MRLSVCLSVCFPSVIHLSAFLLSSICLSFFLFLSHFSVGLYFFINLPLLFLCSFSLSVCPFYSLGLSVCPSSCHHSVYMSVFLPRSLCSCLLLYCLRFCFVCYSVFSSYMFTCLLVLSAPISICLCLSPFHPPLMFICLCTCFACFYSSPFSASCHSVYFSVCLTVSYFVPSPYLLFLNLVYQSTYLSVCLSCRFIYLSLSFLTALYISLSTCLCLSVFPEKGTFLEAITLAGYFPIMKLFCFSAWCVSMCVRVFV